VSHPVWARCTVTHWLRSFGQGHTALRKGQKMNNLLIVITLLFIGGFVVVGVVLALLAIWSEEK
jgi:hypothetical protein